jgi:hypothetical protein
MRDEREGRELALMKARESMIQFKLRGDCGRGSQRVVAIYVRRLVLVPISSHHPPPPKECQQSPSGGQMLFSSSAHTYLLSSPPSSTLLYLPFVPQQSSSPCSSGSSRILGISSHLDHIFSLICPSITIGYHRLYSHRAFRAHISIRFALALLGSAAFQGSIKVRLPPPFHVVRLLTRNGTVVVSAPPSRRVCGFLTLLGL